MSFLVETDAEVTLRSVEYMGLTDTFQVECPVLRSQTQTTSDLTVRNKQYVQLLLLISYRKQGFSRIIRHLFLHLQFTLLYQHI